MASSGGMGPAVVILGRGFYDSLVAAELFSAIRPAVRYRSTVVAAALLVLSGGLAAFLASSRSRQPLAQRIQPAGWGISFEAPTGFSLGDPVRRDFGLAIPFHGKGPNGRDIECAVWRVAAVAGTDVARICGRVVEAYAGTLSDRDLAGMIEPSTLGTLDGVEIRHPASAPSIAARGALGPDGAVYLVSCAVREGSLPSGAVTTFDRFCASIRPARR